MRAVAVITLPEIMTYRGAVYPWHCDHMGHMNVMWYMGKFDEAVWNLFLEVGLTPSYLRSQERGMAAVKASIEYLQELRAGDVLEIRSAVTALGDKALSVRQTMINAETGAPVASIEAVALHLDTRLRKAVAFSDAVRASIRSRFPGAVALPSRAGRDASQSVA